MASSKNSPLSDSGWEELGFHLGRVFKPSTPISREDLFKGRVDQKRAIIDTINQPGQHAVLYGERGVGKTSLANLLFPMLSSTGQPLLLIQVNCMSSDTFSDIWRRVFDDFFYKFQEPDDDTGITYEVPNEVTETLDKCRNEYAESITPDTVRRMLHLLGKGHVVVIVLDEFDTVIDESTKRTTAEMIKFLSDRNVPATLILIGVADDISQLIENHQSIERCLSQIHMPRMWRSELEAVAIFGLEDCKPTMSITKSALHELSRLSNGLPHYMHLLTLNAARAAVDARSLEINESHVSLAITKSIEQAQQSIKKDYIEAISSARKDAKYREVLLACALATSNELGYFFASDVRPAIKLVMRRECKVDAFAKHLAAFCEERKGKILHKDDRLGRVRYRFANPLLQPYVLLRGLSDKIIGEKDLKETRDKNDPQMRLF